MKKRGTLLLVVFLVVVIFGIIIYSLLTIREVRFAPPVDPLKNCSQAAVKGVWELMFLESSNGINIVTNTSRSDVCENYYAWKQVGEFTYVLAGFFDFNNVSFGHTVSENSSGTTFVWGNYTSFVNVTLLNLSFSQVGNGLGIELVEDLLEGSSYLAKNWSGNFTPDGVFSSKFKYVNETPFILDLPGESFRFVDSGVVTETPTNSNFTTVVSYSREGWVHLRNQTTAYIVLETKSIICDPNWTWSAWGVCNGSVQNRTVWDQKNCGINYGKPSETQICGLGCVSNWVAVNASLCNVTESFVVWYNDTNRCANVTAPVNSTGYCDHDKNNLIGRLSDVVDVNLNIVVLKIAGVVVNYSRNYTGEKEVKLIDDDNDIVRVQFDYDFDDGPLNLKKIKVEKQDEDSDFGYLIVEGLDVNDKEFRVDKIYSSNVVCVKDSSVDGPNEIHANCGSNGEYEVVCPGRNGEFNCTDGGYGTYLVRGLDNSGVRELDDIYSITLPPPGNTTTSCQQSWDCGLWEECANGLQRRVCTDYSICPNVTKSYNETQVCTSTCTPDWGCGAWTPTNCKDGEEQTQNCVDANGCGEAETRTRDCPESRGIDWTLVGIIILAAVVVLATIVLIIIVKRRRDKMEAEESNLIQLKRPPAGTYNPTHYSGQGFGQ